MKRFRIIIIFASVQIAVSGKPVSGDSEYTPTTFTDDRVLEKRLEKLGDSPVPFYERFAPLLETFKASIKTRKDSGNLASFSDKDEDLLREIDALYVMTSYNVFSSRDYEKVPDFLSADRELYEAILHEARVSRILETLSKSNEKAKTFGALDGNKHIVEKLNQALATNPEGGKRASLLSEILGTQIDRYKKFEKAFGSEEAGESEGEADKEAHTDAEKDKSKPRPTSTPETLQKTFLPKMVQKKGKTTWEAGKSLSEAGDEVKSFFSDERDHARIVITKNPRHPTGPEHIWAWAYKSGDRFFVVPDKGLGQGSRVRGWSLGLTGEDAEKLFELKDGASGYWQPVQGDNVLLETFEWQDGAWKKTTVRELAASEGDVVTIGTKKFKFIDGEPKLIEEPK